MYKIETKIKRKPNLLSSKSIFPLLGAFTFLIPCAASPLSPNGAESSIIGCWHRRQLDVSSVSEMFVCFYSNDSFRGSIFHNQIGGDFYGKWSVNGTKLQLMYGEGENNNIDVYCDIIHLSSKHQLKIKGCTDRDFDGNFESRGE